MHLTGADRPDPVIVQVDPRRELDLAVEVPGSELGPVASKEMWDEIYDRLLYPGEAHVPMGTLASDVPLVMLNGLSKAYLYFDVAFVVDVDAGRVGTRGQAGHGAHLSADRIDEPGAD